MSGTADKLNIHYVDYAKIRFLKTQLTTKMSLILPIFLRMFSKGHIKLKVRMDYNFKSMILSVMRAFIYL